MIQIKWQKISYLFLQEMFSVVKILVPIDIGYITLNIPNWKDLIFFSFIAENIKVLWYLIMFEIKNLSFSIWLIYSIFHKVKKYTNILFKEKNSWHTSGPTDKKLPQFLLWFRAHCVKPSLICKTKKEIPHFLGLKNIQIITWFHI